MREVNYHIKWIVALSALFFMFPEILWNIFLSLPVTFPPQYTVNKQNLLYNEFILEYWNINVNFHPLPSLSKWWKWEIWEIKTVENQLLLPGLNGLIPWHSICQSKSPPKWIRILESIHINNSLKLSNVTHQGWNALSNRATISV